MRKHTAVLLAVMILLVSCLSHGLGESVVSGFRGEETPAAVPGTFSFRNGVQWGMNSLQVRETEQQTMVERTQNEWSVLYPQNRVEVSRFFADLVYIFHQDRLKIIMYEFDPAEPYSSYQYLFNALRSVYGETTAAEPGNLVAIMNLFYPGKYQEGTISRISGWQTQDGTEVYLYYYSDTAFAILYACPGIREPANQNYATNGL